MEPTMVSTLGLIPTTMHHLDRPHRRRAETVPITG